MEKFTKSKNMVFPREVIVGHSATDEVVGLCSRISSGTQSLVVEDKNTRKISGDKIVNLLSSAGYTVKRKLVTKATLGEVNALIKYAKKYNVDFLLGVGGGSVIDVTKLASYELAKSFISVPTCASHDGIASPRTSLKQTKGSVSKTAIAPLAILADTAVICRAPYRMLASGCADVISNISAVMDWELAHRLKNEEFSSHAAVLAKTAAQLLIDNAEDIKPDTEESAWMAVKAMIVSGVAMSVAGNTRPASGAEHMFSHMLDHLGTHSRIMLKSRKGKRSLHGEQCGVGAIMMVYLHGGNWEEIRDALRKIGAPTTSKELGISKKIIIKALIHAQEIRPERYTILGERGLTMEAAQKLAKTTDVI